MDVKRLYLDGYRNLCDLTVDLNRITPFLSTNNYGKSNVLSGIAFAMEFITTDKATRARMMKFTPNIPLLTSNYGTNFKFEISFVSDNNIPVKYGFEYTWGSNKKEGEIVSEYLKMKYDNSQKFVSCINRNAEEAKILSSPNGRCQKPVTVTKQDLVIDKLSVMDELFYLDLIKEIKGINIFVDRCFDAKSLFHASPIIEKDDDDTSPYHERSIARTLFFLKKNYKERYELIENTIKELFPYIVDIKIKEIKLSDKNIHFEIDKDAPFELVDCMYLLYVTNKNLVKTVDFAAMSDGVKRVLSLLTYITLADINNISIVGIEEPENSIHPGLLKKYMGIINGFLTTSKILITSHSPYLVDYVDFNSLYVGLPNDSGRAEFRKLSTNGIARINNYAIESNVQAGDYLFSLMSSNDEFDKNMLKKSLTND